MKRRKLIIKLLELVDMKETIRIYAEEIVNIVNKSDSNFDAIEQLEDLLSKIVRVSDRITNNTETERIG